MIGEKRMFSSYEKNEDPQRAITFGDGNQGLVKGLGKIAISPDHSISNVFLVDSLDYNLLSVSQLCKMGYNCLCTDIGVTVFRRSDDSIAFKGVLEGQLYLVDFNENTAKLNTCLITKTNMGWLWHRRLAHVGMKNLHKLLKGEQILGLTNVHFEKDRVCSACQAGKQVGAYHPHKNAKTTYRPLELLHMDLSVLIAYISIGGSKYYLVIVDDNSCFTWVFFLQEKSQTQETLKGFLRRAQNEFELRIKKIRSDNGTEFKNSQIEGFLEEEGIKHEFSSPYTPQRNGVVEKRIELYWIWLEPCLISTRHRTGFGLRRLTPPATPSTGYIFTESSRRHHTNSSPVKSPMFHILESLVANVLFLLKEVENLNLLLRL
jgi:transposase InsO family protein